MHVPLHPRLRVCSVFDFLIGQCVLVFGNLFLFHKDEVTRSKGGWPGMALRAPKPKAGVRLTKQRMGPGLTESSPKDCDQDLLEFLQYEGSVMLKCRLHSVWRNSAVRARRNNVVWALGGSGNLDTATGPMTTELHICHTSAVAGPVTGSLTPFTR